eukprot:COSAG01_NODE_53191_length_341_cov_0.561983_2_plen_44_part_01
MPAHQRRAAIAQRAGRGGLAAAERILVAMHAATAPLCNTCTVDI